MKNYFIFLLLAAILYGCNEDKPLETENKILGNAQFSGTISLTDSITVKKVKVFAYDYLGADYQEYIADVDSNGSFSLELPIKQGMEITAIAAMPFSFFAAPGDSIHVAISSVKNDSIGAQTKYSFTGDHATANEELQDYKAGFPFDTQPYYDSENAGAVDDYIAFAKANQQTLSDFNESFLNDSNDPLFKDYLNAQERFFFANDKIDFASYRGYYGLEYPKIDSDYYEFINSIPELKEKDLVNTTVLQRLIYNLTYYYSRKAYTMFNGGDLDDNAIAVKTIELAASENDNELLYNYVLHDLYYNSLSDHNVKVYESTKDQLDENISNSTIRKSVVDKYEAEKKLLESPELPDGAELLTFNTENANEYLDEIIDKANGKVVYIDNWATWCGPCKVEFKNASPKLHEKFKDDVEFVYLCHSSEKRAYIPSIAEFKIKGKHYFLSDEESATISQMINLEGFPTYTVIDKSGEIVLSDYIHRPSYPATTELLTKLTNE